MYVLGTAGHVDHGKSTLVKALTDIDPDRLKEEKDRQMTIDLGFAWYALPSGNEVGIVDVPGHRDFIDNMLAGVGGIDAVLLIVAADEGVMPQTREHLAILKLLNIQYGLVVMTKVDLVQDPEWLDLVEADIRTLVAGSFLEDAPILRVSAYTRQGLPELTQAIEAVLQQCPPKRNTGKPRLPIDRVFSLKGFGTIVTGTLLDGEFQNGQAVEILPEKRASRIRSIQSHKKKVETALPGNRTAINLTGVEKDELKRGQVVVSPGDYIASRRIDAKVNMLADASGKIAHNDFLKCFITTAQSIVRVRVIGKKEILPGEEGWVQLEFEDAIVSKKDDSFILRRPSPAETIAGGVVLNTRSVKRYKRFAEESLNKMTLMDAGSDEEILLSNLDKQGVITRAAFLKGSSFETERSEQLLDALIPDQVVQIEAAGSKDTLLVSRTNWSVLKHKITDIFADYYGAHPLRTGMPRKALWEALELPQRSFSLILEELIRGGLLAETNGTLGLTGHTVQFTEAQQVDICTILAAFAASPYQPPSLREEREKYGEDLLAALVDQGKLLQLEEDIAILPETGQKIVDTTTAFLTREGQISLAQFRDLLQTSRKYALAFLEYLDKMGVTVREGDVRRLSTG
ncbi:MAG: selenocysteine-specific elongation factor [Chloroflexota bacterium]|nr:selenocysteine-specific elongation factor [Chloroflexota bacterium]